MRNVVYLALLVMTVLLLLSPARPANAAYTTYTYLRASAVCAEDVDGASPYTIWRFCPGQLPQGGYLSWPTAMSMRGHGWYKKPGIDALFLPYVYYNFNNYWKQAGNAKPGMYGDDLCGECPHHDLYHSTTCQRPDLTIGMWDGSWGWHYTALGAIEVRMDVGQAAGRPKTISGHGWSLNQVNVELVVGGGGSGMANSLEIIIDDTGSYNYFDTWMTKLGTMVLTSPWSEEVFPVDPTYDPANDDPYVLTNPSLPDLALTTVDESEVLAELDLEPLY